MTPERAEASRRFGEALKILSQGGLTRESRKEIREEYRQAKRDYFEALERERG